MPGPTCGYAGDSPAGVARPRGGVSRCTDSKRIGVLPQLSDASVERPLPRQSLLVRIGMGLAKLKIDDVDVSGKRVLIRVDFNVPQDKKDPTKITNTAR